MFISFFLELYPAKVPASLHEHLTLMQAVRGGGARFDIDAFYFPAALHRSRQAFLNRRERGVKTVIIGIER